jgi:hypothetical protein
MDHALASWIAETLANVLAFEGRLDEALAYADEAIANAGLVGNQGRLANCIASRAPIRLARGDMSGARSDFDEFRRISPTPEPQSIAGGALFDAEVNWPVDPSAACRSITAALRSPDIAPASLLDTAPTAARMAFRVGEATSLASSIAAYTSVADRCGGPIRMLERRWMEALPGEPSASCLALRAVADAFGAIGYRLPAADCHADAAVLAVRAHLDPAFDLAEAGRLYAACGAVPLLGELPEARWIGAAETAGPA